MSSPFSAREILEHYSARPIPHRHGWVQIYCPFHEEKNPSASFNEEEGLVHCFVCSITRDAIGIVKEIENVDFDEAVTICQEITGSDGTQTFTAQPRVKPRPGVLPSTPAQEATGRRKKRKGSWR